MNRNHDPESPYLVTIRTYPDDSIENTLPWTIFEDHSSRLGNLLLSEEQTNTLMNDVIGYRELEI